MSGHKIIRIRPRRFFTALFLVFALFAGLVFGSGAETKAQTSGKVVYDDAPSTDDVRVSYLKNAWTAKYSSKPITGVYPLADGNSGSIDWEVGEKDETTIKNAQYVLANFVLDDISFLLKKSITTSDFQDAFLDVQEKVTYFSSSTLGVVAYARSLSDKDNNQRLFKRYDDLVTLYEYAKKALRKIYEAEQIALSASTLDTFLDVLVDGKDSEGHSNSVKTAVKSYADKYDSMLANGLFTECLLGGDVTKKDANRYYLLHDFPRSDTYLSKFNFTITEGGTSILPTKGAYPGSLTYKETYDEMLKKYEVEKSYKDLNYTKDSTNPIRELFQKFEAVSTSDESVAGLYTVYTKLCGSVANGGMGSKGDADTFIRSLFNGSEILSLITEYENLKSFLVSLDSLPEAPKASEEVARAINTYNKYTSLTESEKKKLSSSDLDKLKKCMPVQSTIDNVKSLIAALTYPKNETEYRNTFIPALNRAETAYNSLRTLYAGTGIEAFVDNRADLTDKYKVFQTYTDRIFDALSIENENVCAKLATVIEPLRNELIKLNKEKTDVFNHLFSYSAFEERYKDATTALKLRQRVDVLMMSPSAQDKAEITSVKNAVAVLNKQAKAYFGSLYEQYIQALEYGTYTDDLNKANRVDTLISRIGTVTSASGDAIKAAMNEYNGLTDVQKSLVKTYPTLVAAQKAYAELSKDLGFADVSNIKKGYVYTHSEIQPQPVVVVGNLTLTKGTHYNVAYSNNLNVGTGTVTITAIEGSGYIGTFSKTFLIVQDSVKNCGVSGLKKKYKWTGKKIKPSFKVTVNGFTLSKGSDYKVSYSNNKKVGTATIKIKGIGNYKGSATRTFKIRKKNK